MSTRLVRVACVLLAIASGALASGPATRAVADALFSAKLLGLTSMILVQLAHDAAALFSAVLVLRLTRRWHAAALLPLLAVAGALLAVSEPIVSGRTDTAIAAWQGLRLVARLSAFLFALTLAAYFDSRRGS